MSVKSGLKTGQASGAVAVEPVGLEAGPSQIRVIGSQSANRTDLLASTIPTLRLFISSSCSFLAALGSQINQQENAEEMLRLRGAGLSTPGSPEQHWTWVCKKPGHVMTLGFLLTCCAPAQQLTSQPASACCSVDGWGDSAPSPWPCSHSTPGCKGRREFEQKGVSCQFFGEEFSSLRPE